jgi:hypothetical protein
MEVIVVNNKSDGNGCQDLRGTSRNQHKSKNIHNQSAQQLIYV